MTTFSRRHFLAATALTGVSGTVAGRALAAVGATAVPDAEANPTYLLEPQMKEMELDGLKVRLRTYNGKLPGPPLTVRPGQTVRFRVKNSLPANHSKGWDHDHNVPHDLNSTNLHPHGLDIKPHLFAPLGTSDPASHMIAIQPGETFDYEFQIPDDHPSGLYWCHPHHHGSTAVQAVSGMAGAIIVRGPIDEVPEIKAAREEFLVVQDIGLFPPEKDGGPWSYEPKQNAIWQTFAGNVTIYDPKTKKPVATKLKSGFTTGDYALRYFLLNGAPFFKEVHNPSDASACPPSPDGTQKPKFAPQQCPVPTQLAVQTIKMAPGEVVRFRMLNGCSDNLMPVLVEGHDMHMIAIDGRNYPEVRTVSEVLLAPGNRAEFLIKAGSPGTYRILQKPQEQQFLASAGKVIAEIVVEGDQNDMKLPTTLPLNTRDFPLIKPEEIKNVRKFQFAGIFPGTKNPVVGADFLINGEEYDETGIPTVVNLDDAEEWHIIVGDKSQGGTEGHPFHVHVNGFEVISIGGVEQPPGMIQDTVWVPVDTTVVIRTKFKQWVGKSVLHCHILPHEDTGMMQNFLIKRPAAK